MYVFFSSIFSRGEKNILYTKVCIFERERDTVGGKFCEINFLINVSRLIIIQCPVSTVFLELIISKIFPEIYNLISLKEIALIVFYSFVFLKEGRNVFVKYEYICIRIITNEDKYMREYINIRLYNKNA